MNFTRICVGSKIGALTGFVSDDTGSWLGLSAFHVLSGSNRIIDPFDDKVEVFNRETGKWLQLGTTVDGRYYQGDGTDANFGILDFAFFQIFNSFKDRIKFNLTAIALSQYLADSNKADLANKHVFGYSVIDQMEVVGRIRKIYYIGQNNRFDVEIDMTNGRTNEGDSGMLWRDEYGHPLFMHIRGNSTNDSTKSYGTFLDRIVRDRTFYGYDAGLVL
ncbi:MAG: hypothetical protein ACYC1Q_05985 [Bacteroidia bacterium]